MRISFSEFRKTILAVIVASETPVSAREVHERVGAGNLATVYRGLQYLETAGLVDAFTLSCGGEGTVRFYMKAGVDHTHFLHCERCHRFTPCSSCLVEDSMASIERDYGYRVTGHVLYFTGICPDCLGRTASRQGPRESGGADREGRAGVTSRAVLEKDIRMYDDSMGRRKP
ncbi:MAG: Fur family transcriptional regulator [Spirochaetes bacterium]|nr:Fur family transcriptional regulator [Spirochaetota bacterium]